MSLPGEIGSPEFAEAYQAALNGEKIVTPQFAPKSLAHVLFDYYRSAKWSQLRPSTQRSYRSTLDRLRTDHGDKPIALIQRRHIQRMMDKARDRPGAANNILKYLKLLLDHAIDMELRRDNPAAGIKPLKTGTGFRTWAEADIAQFCDHHPSGSRARLALEVLLCTGQRTGDAIRMGWHDVHDGRIRVTQGKTGAELAIPIHPRLADQLVSTPRDRRTFIATESGNPVASAAAFGNWFRKMTGDAGLIDCPAHGLRKAAARRLAEAGCTDRQIMAITGHTSSSEVNRYTRGVDQAALADAAIAKVTSIKPVR